MDRRGVVRSELSLLSRRSLLPTTKLSLLQVNTAPLIVVRPTTGLLITEHLIMATKTRTMTRRARVAATASSSAASSMRMTKPRRWTTPLMRMNDPLVSFTTLST